MPVLFPLDCSPEMVADTARMNAEIDPMSGEQILAIIKQAYASPTDVVARAKAAMAPPTDKR